MMFYWRALKFRYLEKMNIEITFKFVRAAVGWGVHYYLFSTSVYDAWILIMNNNI